MTFDEWLFKVVEYIQLQSRREPTEIYSSLDLTDAKLSYLDGITPEEYTTW